MWSAVPDFDDLSSDSETDEVKSGDLEDESGDHRERCEASNTPFVDNSGTAPPRGVAQQHWQTFSKLKRRRRESSESKANTRHGIKKQRIKNSDQKDASLSCPSGSSPSNLKKTDEECSSSKQNEGVDSPSKSDEASAPSQEHQEHWNTLKKHLYVNKHLQQGIDHGQYNPNKSGLEKQLDQAVKEGKFEDAEELSDQLAKRELACKIAKSADARDYLKWKEGEETKRKSKRKKKKLNWGFEAKERWQMKGNM